MTPPSLAEMFARLLRAEGQGRAAKTVELFGWLILLEGVAMLFAPRAVAALLHIQPLAEQAADYLRIIGLLAGGVGMLYVVSGRLNAQGFVFASLLDRPLVPPIMAVLWHLGFVPGSLALAFSVQDFGSFLWTLAAWRAERRAAAPETMPPPEFANRSK
jgi:uncharacterized protein YjeT (DUF2065 family)